MVARAEQLPPLERRRHVPFTPEPIVKCLEVEVNALSQLAGSKQVEDLRLSDLVAQSLAGVAREEGGFFPCRLAIHGNGPGQPVSDRPDSSMSSSW